MPQPLLNRFHFDRFRSSFLPALLIVALGVTGVVTFHAYRASKEHRAVVERVLAAYVSFVAQRVQEATALAINSCAEYSLAKAVRAAEPNLSHLDLQVCGRSDDPTFELDLVALEAAEVHKVRGDLVNWLLDTIPSNPTIEMKPSRSIGNLIALSDGKPVLISYVVLYSDGRPVRALGWVSRGALQKVMALAPTHVTLPPDLHAAGKVLDYFSVSFNDERAAGETQPLFAQTFTTDPTFGQLPITVGLKQAGLLRVAPGGLPRNRGWEFFALFTLATALVASSLLLHRREAELARTRANFVSGVSHELRTPLAQIRMFAEMLLLGRVRSDADRRRSLEIIDTEARRLSQLVENVLQVARSENGHIRVNPTTMAVAPIVRECVESFSVLAQARGIDFRMELQDNLVAPVDSAALRQIVLNLLDNAAKYGPDGQRVVVGVALYDDTARIWVDDEGPGIPTRDRERVFDAFYRTRDAQHTTGSGIGLSVVRELVSLHGGTTWIEDAPDAGARVLVQFPGAQLVAQTQVAGDFAVA